MKLKTGICVDCSSTSKPTQLIAKRCQLHYWQHRNSVSASKRSEISPGDEIVTIHGQKGIVERIDPETELYYLNTDPGGYEKNELRKVGQIKKVKQIKKVSDKRKPLNAIYSILHFEFLRDRNKCEAMLDGCTYHADQIHHRYIRTGYYLICSALFMPVCANCHDFINENSEEAIRLNLSFSRTSEIKLGLSNKEIDLLLEFKVSLP